MDFYILTNKNTAYRWVFTIIINASSKKEAFNILLDNKELLGDYEKDGWTREDAKIESIITFEDEGFFPQVPTRTTWDNTRISLDLNNIDIKILKSGETVPGIYFISTKWNL